MNYKKYIFSIGLFTSVISPYCYSKDLETSNNTSYSCTFSNPIHKSQKDNSTEFKITLDGSESKSVLIENSRIVVAYLKTTHRGENSKKYGRYDLVFKVYNESEIEKSLLNMTVVSLINLDSVIQLASGGPTMDNLTNDNWYLLHCLKD